MNYFKLSSLLKRLTFEFETHFFLMALGFYPNWIMTLRLLPKLIKWSLSPQQSSMTVSISLTVQKWIIDEHILTKSYVKFI